MNDKDWFVIANEEVAIIAKDDGTLYLMPLPVFGEEGRGRDSIETGSEEGKKTFIPGVGLDVVFRLTSDGPVKTHAELPEALFARCQDILAEYSVIAQAQIEDALEEGLTPKQKETDDKKTV